MGYSYRLSIHPTAVIDSNCLIGEGSKIWHFCHIMPGAVIGKNCILGQGVFVGPGVVIGDNCKVQNNVSLFTGVILEAGVFIAPSVVFTNVFNPRAEIERKDEFRKTLIKRGATIGANATVVCGITLGEYCMVGAGSVVTHDVLHYGLVYGNPATPHGWVSQCGEKLKGGKKAHCERCNADYFIHDNWVTRIQR